MQIWKKPDPWLSKAEKQTLKYYSLGPHMVYARWIPRKMKTKHKLSCINICSCHLQSYHNEWENVLKSTLSQGMKPWFINTNLRANNIACSGNTQCLLFPRISDHGLHLTGFCQQCFGNPKALYEDYQLVQQRYRITVTRAGYFKTATSYLYKTERKTKCSSVTWQSMPIQQHPSNKELDIFDHPACSSDLTSSNCHLFGPLQEALRGWQSPNDEMEAVHNLLCTQPQPYILKT
jgi:hypothetical protein